MSDSVTSVDKSQGALDVFMSVLSFLRGAVKWVFSHHRPIWIRITAAATLVFFGHHFLCHHKTVYVAVSWRENKGFNLNFSLEHGEESVVNNIEATDLEEQAMKYHRIHNPAEWFINGSEVQTPVKELDNPCGVSDTLPVQFLRHFKNPCWYENSCGCPEEDYDLRCLPYFYLIGMPKSGTTDLWNKISMHPEIVSGRKEHNYWSYGRHRHLISKNGDEESTEDDKEKEEESKNKLEFTDYLKGFDVQAPAIQRQVTELDDGTKYHKRIIGEGSVTYMSGNYGLKLSMEKEGLADDLKFNCSIAHIISNITPFAKFIILLRDPVSRLYSDYCYLWKGKSAEDKSPEGFHEECTNAIQQWNDCVNKEGQTKCIYDKQFNSVAIHSEVFGLVRSMYSVYIKDWFSSFRREQILIIHEDETNQTETYKKIFRFLELDPLPAEVMEEITNKKTLVLNRGLPHQQVKAEPLLQKTEDLLRKFFNPFNAELADLLDDERYLWKKKTSGAGDIFNFL